MVRDDLAKKYADEGIAFFIVYLPMLRTDDRDAAVERLKDWDDDRFMFYWDGDREIAQAFGKTLEMPARHPVAWDIYFLFDREAKWKDGAPMPDYWMHQLGLYGRDERLLNGEKLQKELGKILNDKKRIEFLTTDGCPNTPLMLKNLEAALKSLGLENQYTPVDVSQLPADDPRIGYGTPTVLVDGIDLMGMAKPPVPGFPG